MSRATNWSACLLPGRPRGDRACPRRRDRSGHRGVHGAHRRPDPGRALLEADLVVDATGRGARGTPRLRAARLGVPEEDEATIRIAYTTRHFRRSPGELGDDQAVLITPTGENLRGAALNAQEDGVDRDPVRGPRRGGAGGP